MQCLLGFDRWRLRHPRLLSSSRSESRAGRDIEPEERRTFQRCGGRCWVWGILGVGCRIEGLGATSYFTWSQESKESSRNCQDWWKLRECMCKPVVAGCLATKPSRSMSRFENVSAPSWTPLSFAIHYADDCQMLMNCAGMVIMSW